MAIRKGEEISTRYISSTLGNLKFEFLISKQLIVCGKLAILIGNIRRRDDIQRYWYFHCTCPRCVDPTELGTYMSAVKCNQCNEVPFPL